MDRLGIIGGSGFIDGPLLAGARERKVSTVRGEVDLFEGEGFVLVPRHGHGSYRPPHRVEHHAHVLAFLSLGIDRVVGINSVGSLDPALVPGTAVIPEDYLSVHPPPTFVTDERLHVVPDLDAGLRSLLVAAARSTEGPVQDGGVYLETRGPRFETRAEIRFYRDHADVIGMTAASEATLMKERDVAYAVLGIVDNFANGLGPDPLTFEDYERQLQGNEARTLAIAEAAVRRFAGEGDA